MLGKAKHAYIYSSLILEVFKISLSNLVAQRLFILRAELWKVFMKCKHVFFLTFWAPFQASAYEACDRTRTPLDTPKTFETCKKARLV